MGKGKEEERDMDEGADCEAEKGRKTALKATRRLARVLGVKFNEGEDSDESAQRDADPFPGFPSRKAARKLSSNERELLVRLLGGRKRGQRRREGGRCCVLLLRSRCRSIVLLNRQI